MRLLSRPFCASESARPLHPLHDRRFHQFSGLVVSVRPWTWSSSRRSTVLEFLCRCGRATFYLLQGFCLCLGFMHACLFLLYNFSAVFAGLLAYDYCCYATVQSSSRVGWSARQFISSRSFYILFNPDYKTINNNVGKPERLDTSFKRETVEFKFQFFDVPFSCLQFL